MTKTQIILLLLIVCGNLPTRELVAQDSLSIKGTVLYSKGVPVPDVSISIENENIAPVFSDSTGNFTLIAPDEKGWLLIDPAYGYKSQRIYIGKRRTFEIYLTDIENPSGYDQINTHMGPMSRRDVLSSVSHRDNENFSNYGYASIEKYMQGSMSGFYHISQTGTPGSGSYTSIRGANSIYASNQPLYIIDGVIMEDPGIYTNLIGGFNYNPIASIKPEDISSVTLLKDASATALYGIKGANGVIIIETLNTEQTETKINFNAHYGVSLKPAQMPVLNADQYRNYAHELLQSVNFPEENIQGTYPGLLIDENSGNTYDYANNTDWQDEMYSHGWTSNAYLSILGGDAVAKYGISFSFDSYDGIVLNSDFRRLGVRLVGDINVLPKLKLYVNAYLNTALENQVEDMTNQQVSPQYVAMAKPPILSPYVYDKNGNQTNLLMDPLEFNISNPLAVSQGYIGEVNNTRILATFRLEGELTDHLNIKSLFSLNKSNLTEQIYLPNIGVAPYENGEVNNISKRTHNRLNALYSNTYLEYANDNSGAHNFFITSGMRISSTNLQTDLRTAKNLPENDAVNNLGAGSNSMRALDGDSPVWTWISFYASSRYVYKDKYFLDALISLDGSSTVGKEAEGLINFGNQPYAPFYSISGAWRISNERFLTGLSRLDELKFRASFSVSGNDDIGPYSALDYYEQVLYRTVTGIIPGRTHNLGLKQETMSMINLGADLSMFGEKLKFVANVFENKTDDLFLKTQAEGWIWDELLARNSGSSTTRGIELEAGTFFRLGRNSSFSTSINITRLDSEIDEIYKNQVVIPIEGGQMIYQSGNSFPQFYGYVYEGVFTSTEEANEAGLVNNANIPFRAGDARFKDLSGPDGEPDGKISDYDKTGFGSPFPELYGGIFNRFTYKRWLLDINFQFVSGIQLFNYRRYLSERMFDFSNQSLNVEQRWRQEGDITNTPRALLHDQVGNAAFSTRWVEDGSYIRLKSAAIRYIIPDEFGMFQSAEFYLTGTNLFTWTNYLGDPEVGSGYQNYQQGIDYGLLPNARTIILGIKLGL